MEPDKKEFITWLKRNSSHLREYTPDEIAHLALHCGFRLDVVCGATADHFTYLKRIIRFWDSPFAGKWVNLMMYDNGKGD